MIRNEVQWIANDCRNLSLFKSDKYYPNFQHIKSKLVLDSCGELFRYTGILFLKRRKRLLLSLEETFLLKDAYAWLRASRDIAKLNKDLAASTAVLKDAFAMDKKDYRLVQEKTIDDV
jgi:hypothetical protein